ncbi:hypothetical protein BO71DRAFT_369019 [Aspergillus ellipticus CBS 707.79]|uniref:Uncharacterized protein n=1 Tax=Aspergillus ellipticus CBS 707.79 TaxID=1448320 RepID=A0A319DPD0_9EURO|nr:hypothetical protein BO71DRAFT_369019 [Aspergillus ellipticus CBS 707.79]
MCGPSRPSTGNLIAIIFPSPSPSSSCANTSYRLSFQDTSPTNTTKATFRITDPNTLNAFRASQAVEVRIERYGDLTTQTSVPPLHHFRVPFSAPGSGEIEVLFPERLELGISERGIVGRQVSVVLAGVDVDVCMGRGVVGFD